MSKKNIKIKTAPSSKESEMMLLGCMLTSVNSLNVASDNLAEIDFYFSDYRHIIFKERWLRIRKHVPAKDAYPL